MASRVRKAGYNRPSRSDVHVNRPLTNVSLAMIQSSSNFIAAQVFPNIPVSKQSDLYFTYDRADWNRDEMKDRAPGTESAGIGHVMSDDTYFCKVKALHEDINDQVRANVDSPLDLDADATRLLTLKALINQENRWATTYFTGGVWAWELDGVASSPTAAGSLDPTDGANNNILQWNDGSSTPIEDIRYSCTYMHQQTGFRPNTMTIGRKVFDALVDHPDIVGRLDRGQTPVGPALATRQALAAMFEMDRILVMDAIQNTAKQNLTATHSFIGGKHCLLSYVPASPGLMTPSAGYTFSWTGYTGATTSGTRVKRFRMDHLESDRIEIDAAYDQKQVSNALGFFFDGIVA